MPFRAFLILAMTAISLSAATPSPPPEPDFQKMNEVFGIPVWQSDNLWSDTDTAVAERLKWPEESRTSSDSSYRLYADSKERVLGARPFSLALYGVHDKPTLISMVFANKGDAAELVNPETAQAGVRGVREAQQSMNNYKKYIQQDAQEIQKRLTELLGPPQGDTFGQGRDTRELVKRWDWKGHSILLAAPREEYVAVRIVPTDSLKDNTTATNLTGTEMRTKLQERIEHRPNGDVVLKDIPMVDQGPKGYCVPATWERALRYMGIPADMYVLAMAGKSETGGGTSVASIVSGASDLVYKSGRRLTQQGARVQVHNVARYIDQGVPIMWPMFVDDKLNHSISDRTAQRANTTDWEGWKKLLDPFKKSARRIVIDRRSSHMCMIIGYNEKTGEIAVSDSWGKHFAERWMTAEEADAISQGSFIVIN
ncbi:MAG: C39 family peptidase [Chthoniobacterales bacterium]